MWYERGESVVFWTTGQNVRNLSHDTHVLNISLSLHFPKLAKLLRESIKILSD